MKTVPTLCASATIVGLSSTGLALGRPESQQPPPSFAGESNFVERPLPPRPHTSVATQHPPPLLASSPLDDAFETLQNNELAPMRRPRGLTLDSDSPRLRAAQEAGKRLSALEQDVGGGGGGGCGVVDGREISARARPSWVKRLSIVSLSQSSTRSTASPASPSYSNGSMAFSMDGSSAPMITGSAPAAPLPPNKLVKRSTSVRTPAGPEVRPSSSSRPTLRRPATSHQRSRTLGSRPAFVDVPPGRTDSVAATCPHRPDPEIRWKQFFSAKGTVAKRRGLSGDPKVITRIVPSEKYHPTLVLANTVTAPTLEMDDTASQAGDSDDARSRPQTPAFVELPPLSPTSISETPAEALASPETGQGADRARRPFSFSGFLGNVPLSRKPHRRRRLSADGFVRASSRLSTATTASTREGSGAMTYDEVDAMPEPSGAVDSLREVHSSYSSHTGDIADVSFESSRPSSSPAFESRTVSLSNTSNHIPSRVPSQHGYNPPAARPVSHRPASPSSAPIRHSRYSITPSEQASTLVGSDSEARIWSGEESDTDLQSDTVFDSMRTRGTRASSGARGPTIETIFDESPRPLKPKISPLKDLLPKGTFPELDKHSTIQEEESNFSTPVRSVVLDRGTGNGGSPTPAPRSASRFSPDIPSSPPKPVSLGVLEWDNSADDADDGRWSFDEDDSDLWELSSEKTPNTYHATQLSIRRSHPVLTGFDSRPVSISTGPRPSTDTFERDTRSSIFDWSESAVADWSVGNRTPPRPNTVHGKKDAHGRGSRSVGRRVPSGLHARSQSVPVVPDPSGKRDPRITNKFGTWGVGSKGVTEDWNDDFDFGDGDEGLGQPEKVESPSPMFVPKSIREQQSNVLANIGLLREWGLLIEELKDLRARAASLNILEGPYKNMWQQVEGMIELADQEVDDEPIVPQLSAPSSPGFDADAFDEPRTATPASGRARGRSLLQAAKDSVNHCASPAISVGTKGRRKSILIPTDDIFSCPSPTPKTPVDAPQAMPTARPRKNSEVVALSVIEALQQRRNADPLSPNSDTPGKKVPFDTGTLKHIVPYVNGLMHQAKSALRETEHLYSSPAHTPTGGNSPLRRFLAADPSDESPSRRSRPRSRMALSDKTFDAKDSELVAKTQQMKLMTVM